MNIKYFVLNTGFKKLLDKTNDLEVKIKNNDPALEYITLDELSYKKYVYYSGRVKIVFVIFFITIVYMAFFSGAALSIPKLLVNNPSYEIKSISFVLSLIISGVISFTHLWLTLSGCYYGPVIQKYVNSVVFFSSLVIALLTGVSSPDFIYFFFIALCCLLIKLILNGQYYSGFIWARMCVRVNNIIFKNEINKLKGFNKKQLREYSRIINLEKRKKIRDKKRANQSVEK
ncbi:hypothetical protein ID853_09995 [Xenorhabdus sp. Vera]|uniref:hypothetical protein n=1 Tax=Xenorhabdus koppenhoeferi TaxID=351659 RepID=UPI00199D2255|nr:hypothetical protein [Xenorhabdus sp. Vera]MBD2811202.1 hypothetical protein [Xenorhabdus sp. Vera]